jgi:hypothetical protein
MSSWRCTRLIHKRLLHCSLNVQVTDARCEVFMAVNIQVEVFWIVTPYIVMVGYQRFSEDLAASIFRVN